MSFVYFFLMSFLFSNLTLAESSCDINSEQIRQRVSEYVEALSSEQQENNFLIGSRGGDESIPEVKRAMEIELKKRPVESSKCAAKNFFKY